CVVRVRSQLCGRVSANEHSARKSWPVADGRVPAAAVPICPRDHIKRDLQWRISAVDVASYRFCRTLSAATGGNAGRATRSNAGQLTQIKDRKLHVVLDVEGIHTGF